MLTQETIINRNAQALATELGDELVIMSLESGNYITLNALGKVIWDEIAAPISVNQLIINLLQKFEVSEQQCKDETVQFLKKLQEQGLIS